MAAADFDLIPTTDPDPYLEPSNQADEPTSTDRSYTTAVMDTDKTK